MSYSANDTPTWLIRKCSCFTYMKKSVGSLYPLPVPRHEALVSPIEVGTSNTRAHACMYKKKIWVCPKRAFPLLVNTYR